MGLILQSTRDPEEKERGLAAKARPTELLGKESPS